MENLRFYDFEAAHSIRVRGTMCVVTDPQKNLLLQYRNHSFENFPNCLCHFGGGIDPHETSEQAIIRELHEEIGAQAAPEDMIFLGCLSEDETGHTEIINTYFWHDKNNSVTGCYEGELRVFNHLAALLSEPKLMPSSRWMVEECIRRKLL